MLRTVIVEDETLAQKKLDSLIRRYDPEILVEAILPSVKSAVKWFSSNPDPDLVFMDIHLEDGLSFNIFETLPLQVPIIFTTAFDEYTINAFKVNSIDYLLKPISYEDLKKSLDKFHQIKKLYMSGKIEIRQLIEQLVPPQERYKSRFLVNEASDLHIVDIKDTAYFFADNKYTYLVTKKGKQHLIDQTLEKLIISLDPDLFYRINRQYIVSIGSIKKLTKYSANKLRVHLTPENNKEIFVSMEKYTDFKNWMNK
ncbi:MAG: LytTR family DNA-binding domain-containing protein [Fulvivirga sp.]|uniref:LytR/AlgR family response regulator transcription factor n=1 Tax=Fulvivirga sp. TaxID=1931237 RepID=UPI0032F0079D